VNVTVTPKKTLFNDSKEARAFCEKLGQALGLDPERVQVTKVHQSPTDLMLSVFVTIDGQPLEVRWSPEASEDLLAFHGISAEVDIVSAVLAVARSIMTTAVDP
jgi:hypothetical protein